MEGTYLSDEGYITKAMDFIGIDKRPADLADYVYNELCFLFDNFYGNPGKGIISADIAENGLDHALLSHGDDTKKLRNYLKSTDVGEYYAAITTLSNYV